MNYDLLSAYTERETNRLVEEDKAVQKKIADNAIAKVMATGNEINANLDNAVATAYRQNERTAQGLKSETSQIGNQALTERLVRNINQNRDNINTNLDNIKLGIDAQIAQNNVKTDREYLLPQAERELEIKVAQAEQDKALADALALVQAQQAQVQTSLPQEKELLKYVPDEYKHQDFGGAIGEKPKADLTEYRQRLGTAFDTIVETPLIVANKDATAEQTKVANNISANFATFPSQDAVVDAIENAVLYNAITEAQARALLLQLGYKED